MWVFALTCSVLKNTGILEINTKVGMLVSNLTLNVIRNALETRGKSVVDMIGAVFLT